MTQAEAKEGYKEAAARHSLWLEARTAPDGIQKGQGPLDAYIRLTEKEPGKGIQSWTERARKEAGKLEKEWQRIDCLCRYEKQYGEKPVCGIDEVGRGPLAGPVVAAAVILPPGCHMFYINDSKKLTAARREQLYDRIMEEAVAVGIGCVSHRRIDEINILQATYEAMRTAIGRLRVTPEVLLNDAVTIPGVFLFQVPIIHGDAASISIGAASIVAKVTRDRMMEVYDRIYPGYGFAGNKGYGSSAHMEAIRRQGPCPIHRRTFLKNILEDSQGKEGCGIE